MHHDPALPAEVREAAARARIETALAVHPGRTALVSSFGAESAVLLHLVAQVDPATPVLFLETGRLFAETLAHRRDLARRLGLTDVRDLAPDAAELAAEDPAGDLAARDGLACCDLRKVRPLARALSGFDAWLTGRKRAHSPGRAALPFAERDAEGRLKVNPLADWSAADLAAHMDRHGLPRHPLTARGYPSLGCEPCTTPVRPGEPARAGRWRGEGRDECGIHFVSGRAVRGRPAPMDLV